MLISADYDQNDEMVWSSTLLWADCAASLSLASQAFIPAAITEEELGVAEQEFVQRMPGSCQVQQCNLLSFLHLVFCIRVRKK